MQTQESKSSPGPLSWVPWIAIAIVGLIYVITMERWFSVTNLSYLTLINGWDWRVYSGSPLTYLAIRPLGLLPVSVQPAALSCLSAAFILGSLWLLARTVRILPQERTRLQRHRKLEEGGILPDSIAWMPATLAVLVCGFQMVIWESATTASGAALDLLILAYSIRAVAEFRLTRQDSWLYKAALVFSMGVVNNYSMLAYGPLFLLAVAWIKGREFFSFRFLSKFALFGAAPLLLHLVVPLMHAFSDTSTRGFWGAMRDYLGAQKNLVLNYRRVTALFLGSISLLPLLCVAFRWGESKGDISGASHQITSWMTHLVHLGFLIVGLAAAFEFPGRGPDSPEISVRYLAATAGDPYALSVYFLCALSAGYCAGYFLLVFGTPSIHRWERSSALSSALGKGVVALAGILLVGVPGSLIYLNWGTRSESRGPALARYGSRMLEAAPDGSFLISDDATLNQLAHASLAATGRRGKVTPFDSGSLSIGLFHAHMAKTLPGRWPALPEKPERDDRVDARYMNLTLTRLSLSNHVSYTQPSFGFFFEAHTLSPTGLLYRLRPLPVRTLPSSSLEASAVSAAEGYLKGIADAEFAPVLAKMPRRKGELIKDFGAALAAQSYSRALNYWGVAARRAGFLDAGERFYRQALVINSNNPSAAINLAFTEYSKREPGKPLPITDALRDLLKPYAGQPDRLLSANGPLDEPSNLTVYSRYFGEQSTLYLQSAMMLLRAAELSGGTPALQLGAARLLADGRRSDLSSMVLTKIRSTAPKEFLSDTTNHLELVELEAVAAHRDGDLPKAEKMLSDAIARYPKENAPYTALLSLHLQTAMAALRRKETNEYQSHIARGYQILQSQLAVQPTNVSAWVNFGATYMRLEDYSNALPAFAKALEMDKGNVTALLNRANCYFRLNQFAAAEQDYLRIRTLMPDSPFQVHYGLGEIASRTGRKKDAIQNFEEYLKKAPEIPEKETVRNKLKELKK